MQEDTQFEVLALIHLPTAKLLFILPTNLMNAQLRHLARIDLLVSWDSAQCKQPQLLAVWVFPAQNAVFVKPYTILKTTPKSIPQASVAICLATLR